MLRFCIVYENCAKTEKTYIYTQAISIGHFFRPTKISRTLTFPSVSVLKQPTAKRPTTSSHPDFRRHGNFQIRTLLFSGLSPAKTRKKMMKTLWGENTINRTRPQATAVTSTFNAAIYVCKTCFCRQKFACKKRISRPLGEQPRKDEKKCFVKQSLYAFTMRISICLQPIVSFRVLSQQLLRPKRLRTKRIKRVLKLRIQHCIRIYV